MEVAEKPSSEIKTANDWIRGSKKRPIPAALFGEFWREGETALLFAETGKGKSALMMQIAQSIASGKRSKPFNTVGKPQKVLYLDLEMNDKQFETRHAADHDGGSTKFLKKHFVFSENLCREELDAADFWVKGERTCDVFKRTVRQLVKRSDASVVIIDSLTCLKRSYYGAREVLDLMTELKKLQREMNISILTSVQTPKQSDGQPLSVNSLRGMKLLCGRADSVFGIGQSRFYIDERYIKRVKALGDVIDFDAMHVPTFRLKKIGGNFLGFEFRGFMPEIEMISDIRASREWNTIKKIKQMNDGGMSIRAIADKIDLPKTTVHRLLQMWRPPVQPPAPVATVKAREEYNETGTVLKLDEMPAKMDETERSTPPSAGGAAADDPLEQNGKPQAFRTSNGEAAAIDNPIGIPGLEHTLDGNGNDIWVQERNERGKHIIWYDLDSKGRRRRMVRDENGIGITQMDRTRDHEGNIIY